MLARRGETAAGSDEEKKGCWRCRSSKKKTEGRGDGDCQPRKKEAAALSTR